jgi:ABC-type transport system involved in multi-copper enzyme maturation permease subunit
MAGSADRTALRAVIRRELRTLARTRVHLLLAGGFVLAVVGLVWVSGSTGFVPTALSLLTPLEVLLPLLTAAFVYRAVLGDRERGELALIRTYPTRIRTYVAGVYLGRVTALLGAVLVPLLIVLVMVALGSVESTFLVQHSGLDSPVLFVRFAVLTALFVAVLAAIFTALSSVVRVLRRGVAVAVAVVVLLVVGLDLLIVAGLATDLLPESALPVVLTLTPNGAYRSLVLETVVAPVVTSPVRAGAPVPAVLALLAWGLGSLLVATLAITHSD